MNSTVTDRGSVPQSKNMRKRSDWTRQMLRCLDQSCGQSWNGRRRTSHKIFLKMLASYYPGLSGMRRDYTPRGRPTCFFAFVELLHGYEYFQSRWRTDPGASELVRPSHTTPDNP